MVFNPLNPRSRLAWLILLLALGLAGCLPRGRPALAQPPSNGTSSPVAPAALTMLSPAATPSPSPSAAASSTPLPSRTPTTPPTPSPTLTASPLPTYTILRGQVLVRSNCRYGPGAPYLYKYGLVAGSNLEVIGRNQTGRWILVRAIGGDNPCWVKASLMEVKGDVMSVAPTDTPLPWSPYYAPLKGVSAVRVGDEVTIYWSPMQLRPGDDSGQYLYLVEAWLCQGGELVFTPLGYYEPGAVVRDEPGCEQPSHARVYGVEKHGYTQPVEVLWPEREG